MICLFIYDIPVGHDGNRIRAKLADLCLDYGMNHIQYSVFAGDLLRTHQEELFERARKQLGQKPGKVHLYCVGEREWGLRLLHERQAPASDPQVPVVDDAGARKIRIVLTDEATVPLPGRRRSKAKLA